MTTGPSGMLMSVFGSRMGAEATPSSCGLDPPGRADPVTHGSGSAGAAEFDRADVTDVGARSVTLVGHGAGRHRLVDQGAAGLGHGIPGGVRPVIRQWAEQRVEPGALPVGARLVQVAAEIGGVIASRRCRRLFLCLPVTFSAL